MYIQVVNYILKFIPIIISLVALLVSINTRQTQKRESKPSFYLVQNLWTDKPFYELINESNSKLDKIPSPSYFMFIPSKIYTTFKNGEVVSLLVLSPVSYEIVKEQIVSGATKNQIVTSRLPSNFTAKKGDRDLVHSGIIYENEDMKFGVTTYPFLVIISAIEYAYNNKNHLDILISTSLESKKIDKTTYMQIMEYTQDNYKQEVKLPSGNSSIYLEANKQVVKAFKNPKGNETFFGGKEGGYGNVLKLINRMITPVDPMSKNNI